MNYAKVLFSGLLQFISYKMQMGKSLGFPVVYNVETTNACSMDCIMCPRSYMTREVKHMDLELFKKIIEQLKPCNSFIWLDHFGDPLLSPHIFEMIALAKSRNIRTGFSTNATSLTPDRSSKLIELKLDLLHISLDGVNQKTYSYYRGRNANYDAAIKNVNEHIEQKINLQSPFPYTTVAMIELEKTKPQVNQFVDLWSKEGIDKVMVKKFSAMDGTIKSRFFQEETKSLRKRFACYFPWSSVTILSDGKVVPCCYDYNGKIILGDLTRESLFSVWNNEKMQKFRKEHISGFSPENTLCPNCEDRKPSRSANYIALFSKSMLRRLIRPGDFRGFGSCDVELWYM